MERLSSIISALSAHAVSRRDEPFLLASGERSHLYVDVKAALCRPEVLRDVAAAIVDLTRTEGVEFNRVGGLTMGADAVAVAVSLTSGQQWFSVRKDPKQRGHGRLIEGAEIGVGDRVLLVDDVVSTGGSTLKALEAITAAGATALAAIPVVDRGGDAAGAFAACGVRYFPLVTAAALGMPPLGTD